MIKNIEDLKKTQIVCRNQKQVKDCLNIIKKLGFKISYEDRICLIICYSSGISAFTNYCSMASDKYVEFYNKELVKTLQKFIKEKEEKGQVKEEEKVKDFEVASDGRVIKINNKQSKKEIFIACDWTFREEKRGVIENLEIEYLDYLLKYGLVYSTKEARDKAVFKMEIETKLKNIAEKLNNGRKIDWEDREQIKYYISYDFTAKFLECWDCIINKNIGQIYCLDKDFLEVAEQEIGKENLIRYFKE